MPRRALPVEAPEADDPRVGLLTETATDPAPTAVAEANELAQVDARAEAARARAIRLREQAEAASRDHSDPADDGEAEPVPPRRRRLRRPSRKALAFAAALVVSCASLAGSGYLVLHHQKAVQQSQRRAEFAMAARNAVVTMMSIDSGKARDDMQRFADATTGQFKASILMGAENIVKTLEQTNLTAKAAVQAVAVQSMTEDSAVVLVAAKSELTKPDQAKPELRWWRLVLNIERDGGHLKVSKVEFVP
jgi:Mce-associated membrane protein